MNSLASADAHGTKDVETAGVAVTITDAPEKGCRPLSTLIGIRYALMVLGIVIALIVIFATPKECPPGYQETDDDSIFSCQFQEGDEYECQDGSLCTKKTVSVGALAAGVILIILSCSYGLLNCCHQGRCVLADKKYNQKVCFCC
ncbi:hypothetical protein EON65_41295 [archaeon]|nr:MAG: hypothetical protein EON65_41295 [archaeon]